MIPLDILRKMNTLKLEMDGVKIQVKVVDNEKLLIEGTEELRNILGLTNCQIVGFDLKPPNFLVLHYKHIYICLLVQLGCIKSFPLEFRWLLTRNNACFLGFEIPKKREMLEKLLGCSLLETGVDIRTFAAKSRHNRDLGRCATLEELVREVGFPNQQLAMKPSKSNVSDWGSIELTIEEIKYAILDAYVCFTLGAKLIT